ncbi:molecular chaperone [Azoarcus sp. KH32C]|uniref:TorD/DmsD family molecular chaperone n=1 Tax=Azoarcus sp. KH32C TaxID=748247 RepID=UPI00023860C1|nr:molecular chaperone TorD family protein [Azoarcus sp. KH32C]BAL22420.1 TorD family cytoplasmic chaperone [Azoarcus sp. KH32C]
MNAPAPHLTPAPTSASDPTWSDEDRARAHHYALLARLFFAAPDAPLLAGLAQTATLLGDGDSPFARAWAALGEAAARYDAAQVAAEYETLFYGIGRPEVMLYGSFYLAGFLMEEPLAHLREDLAKLGLGRRSGVTETEDHIAALAEVMRHLVLTGPDEAGLGRQRHFFGRHLQPWYARLADALLASPNAVFYACVAVLMKAFFDIESEAFAMDE